MVNSLVWTAEEAKYLKAIFHWQESTPALDDEKRRRQAEEAARRRQEEQKPAGELRILVIGGQGTGKTAILTRFGQGTFHGETQPPDPYYERGCRHPITLDVPPTPTAQLPTSPTATTTTTTATATTATTTDTPNKTPPPNHHQQQQQPKETQRPRKTYLIDALEMPSKHLPSNPLLAQALSITEGAVLLYSVRDEASFRLAQGLAEFMRDHFTPSPITTSVSAPLSDSRTGNNAGRNQNQNQGQNQNQDKGRLYPIILVGTKSDSPSPNTDPVATLLQEERSVTYTRGSHAAKGMGMPGLEGRAVPFLEVSAKTGEGVEDVFRVLGQEVLAVRRMVRDKREREMAERERILSRDGSVGTVGGGVGRRWFGVGLWRVLFGFGRR